MEADRGDVGSSYRQVDGHAVVLGKQRRRFAIRNRPGRCLSLGGGDRLQAVVIHAERAGREDEPDHRECEDSERQARGVSPRPTAATGSADREPRVARWEQRRLAAVGGL